MDEIREENLSDDLQHDDSMLGPSRRTVLAAERTWLAWFRTGIGVGAAAIAVGGLLPKLHEAEGASDTGYVVIGVAYGLLAVAIFALGLRRQREVARALESGSDLPSDMRDVTILSSVAAVLAIATVILLIANP